MKDSRFSNLNIIKIYLGKTHLIVIVGASINWRGDRICVLPLVVDGFVILS